MPPANERKKLLPLALMFFCILFNYTILRDTKDVLMVTAPKSGAEVIPFIKTYVNLPVAIGFTALYSKLCDKMEQKKCPICRKPTRAPFTRSTYMSHEQYLGDA